jgi:glycosyltransferase involved in cell wall biosynthesis
VGYSHVSSMVGNAEKVGCLVRMLLFANTDWYLYNYRLALANAIHDQGHELILLSPPGKYQQKMIDQGFQCESITIDRKGENPYTELFLIIKVIQVYRRLKPDLVHHFTSKCVIYGSFAAKVVGIKPIINSITGLGVVFEKGRDSGGILKGVVFFLYRMALLNTAVIFQNGANWRFFLRKGLVTKKNSYLIPGSGVDLDKFNVQDEPQGTPMVILPARMLWSKGVGDFIEAAKILKLKKVKARFVLVGDSDPGNPSNITNHQLLVWKSEGVVEWWGWQEEIETIYPQANIVCLPSYHEGVPKSLIEAASCGRSLVASDISGCREIVCNNQNGFLIPPKNPEKLAKALELLIQNPDLREKMGKESRRIAEEKFSIVENIKRTLEIYNITLRTFPKRS